MCNQTSILPAPKPLFLTYVAFLAYTVECLRQRSLQIHRRYSHYLHPPRIEGGIHLIHCRAKTEATHYSIIVV